MKPAAPHCSGPCKQGHVECPCPQACHCSDDGLDAARGITNAVGITAAVVAVAWLAVRAWQLLTGA